LVTIKVYMDITVIVTCLYFAVHAVILKDICLMQITRIFKIWRWIGPHVVCDVRQGQCLKSLHKALLITSNQILFNSCLASFFISFSLVLAELQTICKQYWNKIYILEGDKWELERLSKLKEFEVKKRAILCECFIPIIALTSQFLLFICPIFSVFPKSLTVMHDNLADILQFFSLCLSTSPVPAYSTDLKCQFFLLKLGY
jgi:hypothetical protein